MFGFSRRPAAPPAPVPVSSYCLNLSKTPAPQPRYSKRKRAEVKYFSDTEYEATDSEMECLPLKRVRTVSRNTKPRPQNKVFPFLKLPAELRNRIYEECLPDPTKLPETDEEKGPEFWFHFQQKRLRRSIGMIGNIEKDSELWDRVNDGGYGPISVGGTSRGTRRGHRQPQQQQDDSDFDNEEDSNPGPKRLGLNMLAVCKQIYEEMAPMIYQQRLIFLDPDALISFTAQLSPRTAKLLRHIEIRSWGMTRSRKTRGYMAMAMLAAKGVTNLEVLKINCTIAWFYSWGRWGSSCNREISIPRRVARKLYRDCHLWLEAVGSASGDYLRGVYVLELQGEDNYRDYRGDYEEGLAQTKKELKKLLSSGT